jgi:transmembrane sensor
MTGANDEIFEQAGRWHFASGRDDMDWDSFTGWLEADPRHRSAYDEIALADLALADHRVSLTPVAETLAINAPVRRRWPAWTGGAIAASLAVVLIVPQLTSPEPRTFTSGAAMQTVRLQDGSQVVLGPQSQLTVRGRHGDQIALDGGAYFAIRHDPSRKLSITAGGLTIGDIGTRFEVQTNDGAVRVEVSEGKLELKGDALGKPIQLAAGRRILFDPAHNLAAVAPVTESAVGEWRDGRLTFDAAPLSLVADDLSRYAGVSVTVPAPLATLRFSGTLSIHNGDSAVRDLAQLMGLELSRRDGAYRLGQRG